MERVDEDVREIGALLADETTQQILIETTTEPMSADELSDACDVSPQTVYRRLEELIEYDMITEDLELDDDGHHYKVYTATLDRVVITLTSDGFRLDLSLRERMAARFTQSTRYATDAVHRRRVLPRLLDAGPPRCRPVSRSTYRPLRVRDAGRDQPNRRSPVYPVRLADALSSTQNAATQTHIRSRTLDDQTVGGSEWGVLISSRVSGYSLELTAVSGLLSRRSN